MKDVQPAVPTNIAMNPPNRSPTFSPKKAVVENRSRLSGAAKTLTFGTQTGRDSDQACVIHRTLHPKYQELIQLIHSLAQSTETRLPYLGAQVLMLEAGPRIRANIETAKNHPDLPGFEIWNGSAEVD